MKTRLKYTNIKTNEIYVNDPTNEASAEQLFYHLISEIAGMAKDCLELIYDEVKEKSQHMNVWKNS